MDLRFEIGVPDYPLDHNGEVQAVAIRGEKGRDLGLRRVPLDEMLAQREALPAMRAVPTVFAFDRQGKRLWVHPLPKGEYAVDVVLGPEEATTFGRLQTSPPSVALPPGTVSPHPTEPDRFAGTLTRPMMKRSR